MASRTQTQVEHTFPLVLRFAEHSAPSQPSEPPRQPQNKTGNKLGGRNPVVVVSNPTSSVPASQAKKSQLELQMIKNNELKIQSLLRRVQSMPEAHDWIAEFNQYTIDQAEDRAISLANFMIEVLIPLGLVDVKTLVCEIIQVMLPEGWCLREFLVACRLGLSEERKFAKKCRLENAVAAAHFEACESFENKDDAQLTEQCQAFKERMRALQMQRRQIAQEASSQVHTLVQSITSLGEQLREQRAAIEGQDLGETSLNLMVAEYRAFLEGWK